MENKKKISTIKFFVCLAAAIVLVAGGVLGVSIYRANYAVDSTVMLDVNPSIEITMNKNEKVLAVTPLNEEAKSIIGDMDFSGSSLEVTVNALIGSMLRNGFITNAENSILISVENDDAAAGQALLEKLMAEINTILSDENISGAVLGQTVQEDKAAQVLAEQNGISVGKAAMIQEIAEQNAFYSAEDLVDLSINELNLISESGATNLENISSIGTASSSEYIGAEAAKSIAFEHSGVSAGNAKRVKCELDWEKGIMVYEVDFDADGYEYEYEINAKTGVVVKFDKEKDDDYNKASEQSGKQSQDQSSEKGATDAYIGEAAAKAAALQHAGLTESQITDYSCELGHERGVVVYEVDFDSNGYEYEYEINAKTGEVVKYEKERD